MGPGTKVRCPTGQQYNRFNQSIPFILGLVGVVVAGPMTTSWSHHLEVIVEWPIDPTLGPPKRIYHNIELLEIVRD